MSDNQSGDVEPPDDKSPLEAAVKRLADNSWEVSDRELWRAFHGLQFERMAQHENTRLQATNFLLAGSLVAVSVVAKGPGLATGQRALLGVIALVNAAAFVWHLRSDTWMERSKQKADVILRKLDPNLARLQDDVNTVEDDNNQLSFLAPFKMRRLLMLVHAAIGAFCIFAAVVGF